MEAFAIHAIVHPSTIPAILDQPRLLQYLQVKGKPRLTSLQCVRQFAHTALAVFRFLEELQSGLIRKRMKQIHRTRQIVNHASLHFKNCISTKID